MQLLLAFKSKEKQFKNMKKASKITVLIAAALLSVGVTLRAAQITGEITFTGAVNLNTASAGTATAVTGWHGFGGVGNPVVVDASGDFLLFVTPGVTTGIFLCPVVLQFRTGAPLFGARVDLPLI